MTNEASFALTQSSESIHLDKIMGDHSNAWQEAMSAAVFFLYMHALNFYLHLGVMLINSQYQGGSVEESSAISIVLI